VAVSLNKTAALDQLQTTTDQFPRRPITSSLSQEQSTISDKNLSISKSSSRLPEIPPLASLQSLSGGHQLQSVPKIMMTMSNDAAALEVTIEVDLTSEH
jgi:hypothetical protein